MCTLACVFAFIAQPHNKRTLSHYYRACTYVFMHCNQGSSVAPGQNFKHIACAKAVYLKKKKHPRGKHHVQQCTHNARMNKSRDTEVDKPIDGQIDNERRRGNKSELFSSNKNSKPSIDLSTHFLMVTIIPI